MKGNYVRARINTVNGVKTIWALDHTLAGKHILTEVTREGATPPTDQIRVYICLDADIVWSKPARMNLHYGELEIIK